MANSPVTFLPAGTSSSWPSPSVWAWISSASSLATFSTIVWPSSTLIFSPLGLTWPAAMVMSMVTALAALVSLGVGVGLADGLSLVDVEADGLGEALVAAGVGVAVVV